MPSEKLSQFVYILSAFYVGSSLLNIIYRVNTRFGQFQVHTIHNGDPASRMGTAVDIYQ